MTAKNYCTMQNRSKNEDLRMGGCNRTGTRRRRTSFCPVNPELRISRSAEEALLAVLQLLVWRHTRFPHYLGQALFGLSPSLERGEVSGCWATTWPTPRPNVTRFSHVALPQSHTFSATLQNTTLLREAMPRSSSFSLAADCRTSICFRPALPTSPNRIADLDAYPSQRSLIAGRACITLSVFGLEQDPAIRFGSSPRLMMARPCRYARKGEPER